MTHRMRCAIVLSTLSVLAACGSDGATPTAATEVSAPTTETPAETAPTTVSGTASTDTPTTEAPAETDPRSTDAPAAPPSTDAPAAPSSTDAPAAPLSTDAPASTDQSDGDALSATLSAARTVLDDIATGAGGDTGDIEPTASARPECPFGDLGLDDLQSWFAEGDGTLLCAFGPDESEIVVVGSTVGDLTLAAVIGADGEPTASAAVHGGAVASQCGPELCIAVWERNGLRVIVIGHIDEAGAIALLRSSIAVVLDGTARFEVTQLSF